MPRARPARGGRLLQGLARRGRPARRDRVQRARGRPRAEPALVQPRADEPALARCRAGLVRGARATRPRARTDPALRAPGCGAGGGGPRALRLARARLRARPARDPGRQQLVRDDRRRGLERAGRALARAALGDRGRDRAVGHRGTDGRARLRQGRRRGLAASAGVGVGGDSRRGGESRCAEPATPRQGERSTSGREPARRSRAAPSSPRVPPRRPTRPRVSGCPATLRDRCRRTAGAARRRARTRPARAPGSRRPRRNGGRG